MDQPSDEELMFLAQQGDQSAFASLVHRHIDTLYHYALRLCRVPAQADDLVQDTWLSAWQNRKRYKSKKAKLTTWLHRILHNKFIDEARKNRVSLDEPAVLNAADPYNAETVHIAHQQLQLLNQAIESLPVQQKAAIVLTHQQGFSNREVAEILGLKVRAVESLLVRARQALTRIIDAKTSTTIQNGNESHAR